MGSPSFRIQNLELFEIFFSSEAARVWFSELNLLLNRMTKLLLADRAVQMNALSRGFQLFDHVSDVFWCGSRLWR